MSMDAGRPCKSQVQFYDMGYFDDVAKAHEYIKMASGYDGRQIIKRLHDFLPPGKTVLEIGMGPGVDLAILQRDYTTTGSDAAQTFIDIYREKNGDADLMLLDAVTLDTDRRFDAIYSNKVLHHLHRSDLERSLARQREIVTDGGILCHSFWRGEGEEEFDGLRFSYYNETELETIVASAWTILDLSVYREMEEDDSILLIAQKK